jgi:YD repeat-containing protein
MFPQPALATTVNASDYEEYGYDADSNRTSLRKRDGSVLTFDYDALGRMVRKIVPERAGLTAAQTRDVYYEYDLRGLQTKARFDALDGEGVAAWYDGFGQAVTTLSTMGGEVRYLNHLYDADGHRTRLVFAYPEPDVQFGFVYDSLGRMSRAHDNAYGASLDDVIIRYWWKLTGERSGVVRGAGSIGFTTIHYYDPAMRPSVLANGLPGTGFRPRHRIWLEPGRADRLAVAKQRRLCLGQGDAGPFLRRRRAQPLHVGIGHGLRLRRQRQPDGRRLDELHLRRREPAGRRLGLCQCGFGL